MQFVKESRIAAPPERVFAFHETPDSLRRLTPPWERVEVVQLAQSLRPGNRAILRGKVGPFKVEIVAEHTEYDPPHRFVDRMVKGPFARWEHTHGFLDDGEGGTILRDEIDLEPPLGPIGAYFSTELIRRRLERMFEFRHETTRRIVESGDF
jgi:ligand-binding SRPBCC domain-containing protein